MRRTVKEHGPDLIDIHVGGQLRVARELVGLTQNDLAHNLGVSFQLVQKHERGEVRISASRLFKLAQLLNLSIGYFFDEPTGQPEANMKPQRGEIELLRAYRALRSSALRQSIRLLAQDISNVKPIAKKDPKKKAQG